MSHDRKKFTKQKTMQLFKNNDVAFANEIIIKKNKNVQKNWYFYRFEC